MLDYLKNELKKLGFTKISISELDSYNLLITINEFWENRRSALEKLLITSSVLL